jgi:small-conductance mechanosensitive channel
VIVLSDNQKGSMADDTQLLETPEESEKLQSGEDLALAALSQQSAATNMAGVNSTDSESEQSDKVANTLTHLQNVIERNANELARINGELKEHRDSMKSVFENDAELSEASDQAQQIANAVKARRTALQNNPQVTSLKAKVGDLNEQKKEIEETISNHLVNYFALTNSKSFDTSDGDQWEFDIKAKVKSRKK